MDYIQIHHQGDTFGSVTPLDTNFGVDVPRVGDHLMLPEGVNAIVTKVVRRFRPGGLGRGDLIQYDRHVYADETL